MNWFLRFLESEKSGVFRAPNRFWLVVGCCAAFGYAFFALQFSSMDQPFYSLMVLAFLASVFFAPKAARTDPVILLGLAGLMLAIFSFAQTNLLIPAYAEPRLYIAKAMAPFSLFLMAWWLGGSERNVMVALGLGFAGIWAAILGHQSYNDFLLGFGGQRVAYGFWNAGHTGVFFGTALIGWTIFAGRVLSPANSGGRNLARAVLWGVGFLVLAFCLITSQARAAWLGVMVAALVGVGGTLLFAPSREARTKPLLRLLLAITVTAVVLVPVARGFVEQRLAYESDIVSQADAKGIEALPDTSMGIRFKLWKEGLVSAAQRPLTGWGFTARNHYIQESEVLPDSIRKRFGHSHNSYLEVLLAYGIPGVLLYGALLWVVAVRAWRTWRAGEMPADVMLFGACAGVFLLVVNGFETYVFGKTGFYTVTLVGGVLYTFVLAARQRQAAALSSAESAR